MPSPQYFEGSRSPRGRHLYVNRLRAYGLDLGGSAARAIASQRTSVWLMCDDYVLDPIAKQLENNGTVTVLRTNGRPRLVPGCWPTDQSLRLTHALAERSVRALVVCGHARCAAEDGCDAVATPATGRQRSILQRVAQQQLWSRQARDLFAERVQAMQRLPAIARAIGERGITFCGMWYLPETGFWMRYCPVEGWSDSADSDFDAEQSCA